MTHRGRPPAALLLLSLALGCRGAGRTAIPSQATSAEATGAAPAFDPRVPPAFAPLIETEALKNIRALAQAGNSSDAARRLDEFRARAPDGLDPCALAFLSGKLHAQAKEPTQAAQAYDEVPEACVLRSHARLHSAEEWFSQGRYEDALARLGGIPDSFALVVEAKALSAMALFQKGARRDALPQLRELLHRVPAPKNLVELQFTLALVLLDDTICDNRCDPKERAKEALQIVSDLLVSFPKYAEKHGLATLRQQAFARAGIPPEPLSDAAQAKQLAAWLSVDPSEARKIGPKLLGTIQDHTARCKATIAYAHAVAKEKKLAALRIWEDAELRCKGEDELVSALYYGAKAASGKDTERAIARYSRIETEFHSHRLADDARFHRALLTLERDEDTARKLLVSLGDEFPEGDMREEALFRAALSWMLAGAWERALEPLDRLRNNGKETAATARANYYYGETLLQIGRRDEAVAAFEHVIRQAPLSYFMALGIRELNWLEPGRGDRALQDAFAAEAKEAPILSAHPEFSGGAFSVGLRLLEAGDIEGARGELSPWFKPTKDGGDDEISWLLGSFFNRAGAFDIGHNFARSRARNHVRHFPSDGRWRFAWEVAYPLAFREDVEKQSYEHALPVSLTWGIMREESSFLPEAKSPADAFGLMQLIVPTAKLVAKGTSFSYDEDSLRRADVSVALGTKLLGELRRRFSFNPALAIPAYNAGAGAVERWLAEHGDRPFDLFVESIPYEETRNYVKKVLGSQVAYDLLYHQDRPSEVLQLPRKTRP